MADIITITKSDSKESIIKRLKNWSAKLSPNGKSLNAKKFTGKIKSFGDGLDYQKKIRNEWS